VVNVALPAIRAELDTGLAAQQWIVEAYLLTVGALLLVGGSLGDLLGRRRVFAAGLIGFALTSVLCALAPGAVALVAGRALQGVAGALLVPASLAIITSTFPAEERGSAIGSWSAWTGVAFVLGPLAGGALIDLASWRWIFAINVPLVAVCLLLLRWVPKDRATGSWREVDLPGAVLGALALAGPVFALIEQPVAGWSAPQVWAPLTAGVLLGVAFVSWEAHTSRPMLPLELFANRNFAVGNLATLAVYGALGIVTFLVTIFLQQVAGYSAVAAGSALLPITAVMWLLSKRFGRLSDRIGPRVLMGVGPIVAGIGMLWMAQAGGTVDYARDLLPGVLLFGGGLAATVAPLTSTVLGAVEEQRAGVASGANNAIARIAALLAIAALGAVVGARYAHELDLRAARLDLSAAERRTLAELRTRPLAGDAPVPELRAVVRESSVAAYRWGVTGGGLLMVLGGTIALVGIVNPRPTGDDRPAARSAPTPSPLAE
jgi:EmrB/QacA subfamily drug resistance transporter